MRIEGAVEETTEEESIEYWESRPRGSQVAAWASPQSLSRSPGARSSTPASRRPRRDSREAEVPLPPFWGGYRVVPERVEFWTHRDDRLHDRVLFVREAEGWRRRRLAP